MEIWKEIDNFNGKYLISNYGNVKSLNTNIILKPGYNNGYLMVNLKGKMYYIHRLVAIYFLQNTDNKKQVNHIDFNKANNYIDNLEWCSAKENMNHYWGSIGINNNRLKRNYNSIIKNDLTGINFYKPYNKWRLRLNINGLQKSLGYFNSKEEALEFKNTYI